MLTIRKGPSETDKSSHPSAQITHLFLKAEAEIRRGNATLNA
jgi:hypothetical protein